ncbi:LPXTG cell wall anchor domain-containing protein, partial [Salmonella enterica subsp. enterica serovar Typhi]|nr:LPXTG cell wall anchor domain-containing protein [Salmonella enterica subsp. enterica serovar Typhi]
AIVAPAVEEKPEFDLSSLEVEPEHGQIQNLAANPETQETATEAHSRNLLPNTGTESKSLLALAGFSILALLGLGWLMKNKKKN